MKSGEFELAVVGGGIAALTAAWHAAQNGCRVVLITGTDLAGGLVTNIGALDGFPAVAPTAGLALAERLIEQAKALGVEVAPVRVEGLSAAGGRFVLQSAAGQWRAAKVIAATGARLKDLEVAGAETFRDKGVLQCAWCNAGLFRGRQVVVVGAGDAAFQEAAHLARMEARLTMVVRGEQVRARRALVEQVAANEAIVFLWSSEVTAVTGAGHVTGVSVRDVQTGVTSSIACDAVFPYIGLRPNSAWLDDLVERDPAGAVITDAQCTTRTPGLFAIGALRHGYGGRLTHAMGEATSAAIAVAVELEGRR